MHHAGACGRSVPMSHRSMAVLPVSVPASQGEGGDDNGGIGRAFADDGNQYWMQVSNLIKLTCRKQVNLRLCEPCYTKSLRSVIVPCCRF